MRKLALFVSLLLSNFGLSAAACPDLSGLWDCGDFRFLAKISNIPGGVHYSAHTFWPPDAGHKNETLEFDADGQSRDVSRPGWDFGNGHGNFVVSCPGPTSLTSHLFWDNFGSNRDYEGERADNRFELIDQNHFRWNIEYSHFSEESDQYPTTFQYSCSK